MRRRLAGAIGAVVLTSCGLLAQSNSNAAPVTPASPVTPPLAPVTVATPPPSDAPAATDAADEPSQIAAAAALGGALVGAAGGALVPAQRLPSTPTGALVHEPFDYPDGLLTNEYAHWNPHRSEALRSPRWDVTSGSLFVRDGHGWTGVPDRGPSQLLSDTRTGSAVFRAFLAEPVPANVSVSLRIRPIAYFDDGATNEWDGAHLLLRYQGEETFYSVSVARRDGSVAIKRKLPGGTINDGRYVTLAATDGAGLSDGWHDVVVAIADTASGVRITVVIDGQPVLAADDTSEVITGGGQVGVRGDNLELEFDDIVVMPA